MHLIPDARSKITSHIITGDCIIFTAADRRDFAALRLRRRLHPLHSLYITTFLLHCGCALLSHHSVERLNSVPASISESHPHIRVFKHVLACAHRKSKMLFMSHRIHHARAFANERDIFHRIHWTHASFPNQYLRPDPCRHAAGRSRSSASVQSGNAA